MDAFGSESAVHCHLIGSDSNTGVDLGHCARVHEVLADERCGAVDKAESPDGSHAWSRRRKLQN